MLKKRIVATLVVKDGIAVQSINFKKYLPVGRPEIAIESLNQWGIDEIILLDICASRNNTEPDFNMVKKAAQKCYVPLTVGGGIKNIEHIRELMHCGADKVSLNHSALYHPQLITEAARIFGDQCIVVSIDAISTCEGYRVYDHVAKGVIDYRPSDFAKKVIEKGAGEILINAVDRDGCYSGFDIALVDSICVIASVPVICLGGAKNAVDFIKVLGETKVSAASAANLFHFKEHSVNITKAIINRKLPLRVETHAAYKDSCFDDQDRLIKKTDSELEEMLFIRIEKEII